jgi:hypothetical protein
MDSGGIDLGGRDPDWNVDIDLRTAVASERLK